MSDVLWRNKIKIKKGMYFKIFYEKKYKQFIKDKKNWKIYKVNKILPDGKITLDEVHDRVYKSEIGISIDMLDKHELITETEALIDLI